MSTFQHFRDPGSEIDRIWALRRSNARGRWRELIGFAEHPDPTVRGESVSVLGKWRVLESTALLTRLLAEDVDPAVRERCALALGAIGDAHKRKPGVHILKQLVLSSATPPTLRDAAYQALLWMHGRGDEAPLASVSDDVSWVASLPESE